VSHYAHPTAVIDEGATIGDGTKIWHFSHVCSSAVIGNNCSFGQGVYIAPDVRIGDNVRVQNGVSIYTGVTVEDYCFIGPHAVFTNDRNPRSMGPWKLENTVLRRGASVGANATVLCGIELGEFSMVGCGSVATRTVAPRTLVVGNPARPVKVFTLEELSNKFTFLRNEL